MKTAIEVLYSLDGKALIYDSQLDRPSVKMWLIFPKNKTDIGRYEVLHYGGFCYSYDRIIHAADGVLSNFYLYGGYAGEYYMKDLVIFVKNLNIIIDEIKHIRWSIWKKEKELPCEYRILTGTARD